VVQLADLFRITAPAIEVLPSDWDELVHDASSKLLLPTLWQRVRTFGLTSTLPAEIQELLATTESLNGERNQRILEEAVSVAGLMNTIGIRPVALKGLAYLLKAIYSNPASRYLLDIDLLIPETRIPEAVALLHQHGFVIDDDADIVAPLRHHSPSLIRDGGPSVELHHRLGLGVCNRLLPAAEIFNAATPVEFGGAHFLVPCMTHLANHLILHSQLHDAYRNRVFCPLRALYDLAVLTETRRIDWDALATRYGEQGEYFSLALHLKEAERVLGLQPPFALELDLFGRLRWLRRRTLVRFPRLRFLDPFYILLATFRGRLRFIPRLVEHPEHFSRMVRALTGKKFYRDLVDSLIAK
jgi:hypothetical protein